MTSEDHEALLEQAIAEYLIAQDNGPTPDRNEFLKAHPALAADLLSFFQEHDRFAKLATPLHRSSTLDANDADPEQTVTAATSRSAGPQPGNRLLYFGDYEIREEIGRGGMGIVYRARQVSLNRFVALKMIRSGLLAGDDELRRFQNEAEAVALLDHPGIVPIYEVGELEGKRYFSMKLIETSQPQPHTYRDDPRAAAKLVAEAAEAIAHAHARGVLHRDLKLANLLIDTEGKPHVTDFGLAKRMSEDSELTQSGAILGTPAYMSPEQAAGQRSMITTATDVYGLGAVLYGMLTSQPPFGGDSLVQTLEAVRTMSPKSPSKLNKKIPRDLETICLKCLEKDPKRRYSTAQALADDLRAWLEHRPIAARRLGVLERAVLFARRKPASAAAFGLTVAVVLLIGIGVTIAWLWRTAEQARTQADAARAKAASVEYGRTVEAAHDAWRQDNVTATLSLLETTPPELRGWEWNYVESLCHRDVLRLDGLSHFVAAAAYSEDGSRIATLNGTGTFQLWSAVTGRELPSADGQSFFGTASYSPDLSRVVLPTTESNVVKLRDVNTGKDQCTLKGHTDEIASAVFDHSGSRVITSSFDGTAKVWDAHQGAEIASFQVANTRMLFASMSNDAELIATATDDKLARIWETKTGDCRFVLAGHSAFIHRVEFSDDGSRVVTAGQDKTARIWDTQTGLELQTLKGHTRPVFYASFSRDGTKVVTSSEDRTARVWDASTGLEIATLKGHRSLVWTARFSPDGSKVITTSSDRIDPVRVWNARNSDEFVVIARNEHPLHAEFSPDAEHVALAPWGGFSAITEIRNARTGQLEQTLNSGAVTSTSYSADGRRIVTAGASDMTKVWDTQTGTELATLNGHQTFVTSAALSPNGQRIVTTGLDETVKVWNAVDGTELFTLNGHEGRVASATFSPDNKQILSAGDDKTLRLWDAFTGRLIRVLTGHTKGVSSAGYNIDGTRIVSASFDNTAIVWDAKSDQKLMILRGHTDPVWTASFSPDSARILTSSSDHTARLWDARSGTEVLTLKGHLDSVRSASFSQDGTRILTSSDDGTARIWQTNAGR